MKDSDKTRGAGNAQGSGSALGGDTTLGGEATVGSGATGSSLSHEAAASSADQTLALGTVLAGRYQVVDVLGVGGMGAVYKVFDVQLSRIVALKTILPELAASPVALKRFKQEVLLAQSIIHKNVVRIFDIGEDGATKFITMDFIEGIELKRLVSDRGKLRPEEAAGFIRQVCQGLEAAHAVGIVHRDLKPQNVMVHNDGHVVVMDFGIARSNEGRGATQTGAFLGTPDYMSPEQAEAEAADARSDIYSMGLIFYELLTGQLPFKGKTALETMFKRTKEQAAPPVEIESGIPKGINEIVVKCLQRARENRYQTVTDLLQDLESYDPNKKVGAADRAKARLRKASRYRNVGVATAVALAALVAGYIMRNQLAPPAAPTEHDPVTVLIADFNNRTGEPVFDGTLPPVVKLALEGAGFITAFDRTKLRDLGVPPVDGAFDEQVARRIAYAQGLGIVISGSLERDGTRYKLSMKTTEAVTGDTVRIEEATASDKDQVLFITTKLAGSVRTTLGDDTSESAQRFALETLSAASLEAVHEYSTAMNAVSNAKYDEALNSFLRAVSIDENFGLAYAGMAVASSALNQQQDAEKYIGLANKHLDRMTERERFRTRGFYFRLSGDPQKCVEEYTFLIKKFPSDAGAHNNLAGCLSDLRNIPEALSEARKVTAILPKRLTYRLNVALFASYGSDFQTGEREARAALAMDPSSMFGLVALGLVQLGQGNAEAATGTYSQLEKLSPLGASYAKSGLADVALYEGRFSDAARILENGAREDIAAKAPDRAADKFAALAYTRLSQRQKAGAVAAANSALSASNTLKIRFLAGRILAAAGQTARAKGLAAELAKGSQPGPQASAKLIEGEIALEAGDAQGAVKLFTEARNLLDTWISHYDLGRAYLAAGLYTEADSEFDRVIRRRGEALSLFLDQVPTYGYFPSVYYYLGRVRQGQKSPNFTESYKKYLEIREKAGEDPLLAEVRKLAGQ